VINRYPYGYSQAYKLIDKYLFQDTTYQFNYIYLFNTLSNLRVLFSYKKEYLLRRKAMDDFNAIMERAELNHIREFILYGKADKERSKLSYSERLQLKTQDIYSLLTSMRPAGQELDWAIRDLTCALDEYERVYMEIGMKAGARLLYQLLGQTAGNEAEK